MKKCPYSNDREKILADALRPIATELRLLDAADLVSLLRYERWGNLSDLVSSAAELYYQPGTIRFGVGGDYSLEWNSVPEIMLDLEIKPDGVSIYAKLSLADTHAGVDISHISFNSPSDDPNFNTAFMAESLAKARFDVTRSAPEAGDPTANGNAH